MCCVCMYVCVSSYCIVGDSDGIHATKRFFTCPDKHGIIVPVENVSITATNVRLSFAVITIVDPIHMT